MQKSMPWSEAERTEEALALIAQIQQHDVSKVTGWELNTIDDIKAGKAATPARLREFRHIVKRLSQ